MSHLPRILVIGATPPPYNGMSVVLENLLGSQELHQQFDFLLLDIADRRGLNNVGRFDWQNIALALRHGLSFVWLVTFKRPRLVYLSIAQNIPGYLRDCLFLVPARFLGLRVVVHLHGSDFGAFFRRSPDWMRRLIRWTLGRVRRAIVLGKGLRKNFDGMVPMERVMVLPNGIRPISTTPDAKESTGRVNSACQIVYLGTLKRAKGFLDVLYSVPSVVREVPNAHFVLAGEHCYPDEIQLAREFIQQNQLQACVEMPGVVVGEDKARLLLQADVFVFPPIAPEGQPLVILEAMAAGLPVIATSQGAISEVVIDGVNGFLIPPGDPTAIAEKIVNLIHNPTLRRNLGRASLEVYQNHYTLNQWASGLMQILMDALDD